MELKDILDRQAVGFVHNMNSKKRLLQHIAEQAHQVYGLNGEVVFDSLTKREHLGSTGVGRGGGYTARAVCRAEYGVRVIHAVARGNEV